MSRDSIKPVVGSWVSGDSLFGREQEVAELLHCIANGGSVSLAAPRRMGKTSVLREVARRLDGGVALFVDVEGCADAGAAVAEICAQAKRHRSAGARVWAWVSGLVSGSKVTSPIGEVDLRDLFEHDWQARGAALIAELCREYERVVLILDELPVLVATLLDAPKSATGRGQADLLLSWLRKLTQDHSGRFNLVITGSIGLAPMVARAGLSATLNAYEARSLAPWPRPVAEAALRALATYEALTLADGVPSAAMDLLGVGVPYHVQLVYGKLAEDARRRGVTQLEVGDVQRVWRDLVLPHAHADLPHWSERLKKSFDAAGYRDALRLLTRASRVETLSVDEVRAIVADSESRRVVLETLEHDGYLARTDAGWYFPNGLLRAWWGRRYADDHGGRP